MFSGPKDLIQILLDISGKARELLIDATLFLHESLEWERRSTIDRQLLLYDGIQELVRLGTKATRLYDEMVLDGYRVSDESLLSRQGVLVSRYLHCGLTLREAVEKVEGMGLEG